MAEVGRVAEDDEDSEEELSLQEITLFNICLGKQVSTHTQNHVSKHE
jgi:hypothetical protein